MEWRGPDATGALDSHARAAGETVTFGSSYVHDVRNHRVAPAVTVHAYSPPIRLMHYYDASEGTLLRWASSWTDDPEAPAPTRDPVLPSYTTVEEMLEVSRGGLARLTAREAAQAVAEGAQLVDIRPEWQRRADGEIPGAIVVERNHLEWRLHPGSDARLPLADRTSRWVIYCTEGYTSSLAAASLVSLGLDATDVIGGIHGWRQAGFPTVPGGTALEQVVAG